MSDRSSASVAGTGAVRTPGRGLRRLVDAALLDMLAALLNGASKGHLHLTLPSGRSAVLGQGGGVEADLTVNSYALLWKAMRRGHVGFADAYICGEIDSSDLGALLHFCLDNAAAISAAMPRVMRSAPGDVAAHARRRNTRAGSRRNIAAHYDLGNAFYALWLDARMSYSSGIYTSPGLTLDEAQAAKHARILAALELDRVPDCKVLEIGCGWGALAEEIAQSGAHLTAITISTQQLEATRERLARPLAAGRAQALFQDYRDTTGSFDRVVSIEMIEAVGEDNWPIYFRTLHDRLRPGGHAVVQAITIRDDIYEDYRRNPDFIQRYIFPGGMLPTLPLLAESSERAGLVLEEIERFGPSYALTCAEWRRRFIEAWPRIEALGFDERFRRMWIYYLTYCEIGFQHGTIDVGIYRLRKPQGSTPDRLGSA